MSQSTVRTPPAGWPPQVSPPGTSEFESSAVRFLLSQVPGEWRAYEVYQRHPYLLARDAWYHLRFGLIEGQQSARARARTETADHIDPPVLEALMTAYRQEVARATALLRQVELVGGALKSVPWMGSGA